MIDTPKVVAARIDVARRRAALIDTAHQLQARLAPATLASEAWDKAKNKGADIAENAVDAVRARPATVGGIAAAVAMFLAREPIKDAAARLYGSMTSGSRRRSAEKSETSTPRSERKAGRRASTETTENVQ